MTHRRTVLGGAVAGVASLAGCLDSLTGSDTGDDGEPEETGSDGPEGDPLDTARDYFEAVGDGDYETANDHIHSDSGEELTRADVRPFEEAEVSIDDEEILEETSEEAIVRITLTTEQAIGASTDIYDLELRPEDDEWAVVGEPEADIEEGLDPEEVVVGFWEAIDDGDFLYANGLVHTDSPTGDVPPAHEEIWESLDVTVTDSTTMEEESESAVVAVDQDWVEEVDGETNEMSLTVTYEVRTDDGEWRLYEEKSTDSD